MKDFFKSQWRGWVCGFLSGVVFAVVMLVHTIASARSLRLSDFTLLTWVFVIAGILIVLLQLIPAIILFASFIEERFHKEVD